MRKIRSELHNCGFPILVVGFVSLFVIMCMCVMLGVHRSPVFGMRIEPEASHYVMGAYDRSLSHFITVTPGKTPRFFVEEHEIPGGLEGMEPLLKQWETTSSDPHRVRVVLVCDRAVPAGTVQRLVDMVLGHGFDCAISGLPPQK